MYKLNVFGDITKELPNGYLLVMPKEGNSTQEYQEYLAWLADGNEPLPPDQS